MEIAAIHLKKRGRNPTEFDLESIADASEGFSGAEIETAITDTLFQVFPEGRDIKTKDVVEALKRTSPISLTMKEEIDALRDWAKSRNIRMASSPAKAKVVPRATARTVEAS
jgi:SpoVK/Ycf46/Vps4 family AAA+-type ATPase